MEHELKGIRYQSKTYKKVETLMDRVNEESIKVEHRKQESKKAKGIDGVSKDTYGVELDENVADLIARMKKFSYKPLPVRRTYIPKLNGKLRPLGIPAYEDRLVQGAMAGKLALNVLKLLDVSDVSKRANLKNKKYLISMNFEKYFDMIMEI